ncbi:CNNM domain-containing protein, partial [Chloroflexota bacterium]
MMDPDLLYAIGLVVFLLLNLITSAACSAVQNVNLARILAQREEKINQVNHATELLADTPRTQASLKLFQSIMRFFIAGLILLLFVPMTDSPYLLFYSLGVLLLAAVIIFFLEWLIETSVSHHPETWVMRLILYMRVLYGMMTPILAIPFLFTESAESNQEASVTETELISLVEAGQEEGLLEQEEQKMIVSIFRLGDTLVREIMVPRIDILAL